MGRMIATVAKERGHEIVCIVDQAVESSQTVSPEEQRLFGNYYSEAFRSADVAIEFSRPDAAEKNVRAAMAQGVAVVSGTTGWNVEALKEEMQNAKCKMNKNSAEQRREQNNDHPGIIWSSNYSIGVNILFAVNKYLARLLQNSGGYSPSITEIHHIHKLDAPSGTAVTLREGIVESRKSAVEQHREPNSVECPIESVREGEVPGIHEVRWESEADILTLKHEAKSRKGFALGAVLAAEWLKGKKGWHTMSEVMEIDN